MNPLISWAHSALKDRGFVVSRARHSLEHRRAELLRTGAVTTVLDVGANTGQYARALRHCGWKGRIVSFEPQGSAFAVLSKLAETDPQHECFQLALGANDGVGMMNIAPDSTNSSLFMMSKETVVIHPSGAPTSKESVKLARLDSLKDLCQFSSHQYLLKIDTQGYELDVLKGAIDTLQRVLAVEVELSFRPLYQSQPIYLDVFSFLQEHGFTPIWIERGFVNPNSGDLLQCDALLVADDRIASSIKCDYCHS